MNDTSSRLDETAIRAPEFSQGRAVTLSDGQAWTFPKPARKVRPRFGDDGVASLSLFPSFGRAVDDMLAPLRDDSFDDPALFFELGLSAAATLLRRNYTLSHEQLADLLEFNLDDEASVRSWQAIGDILLRLTVEDSPRVEPAAATAQPQE